MGVGRPIPEVVAVVAVARGVAVRRMRRSHTPKPKRRPVVSTAANLLRVPPHALGDDLCATHDAQRGRGRGRGSSGALRMTWAPSDVNGKLELQW